MNKKTFLWTCTLLSIALLLLVSCQKATVGKAIGAACDANVPCDTAAGEVCVAGYCEADTDGDAVADADDQCPDQAGDPLYFGCPVCGNEIVEDGEDCDDGLHCTDGTSCTVNTDCDACVAAGDCLDNTCMPRSGDGCTGAEQADSTLHCQNEAAPDAGTGGNAGAPDTGAQGAGDTGTAVDGGAAPDTGIAADPVAQGVEEMAVSCQVNIDCPKGKVCVYGVCIVDGDGDSAADDIDNCPLVSNAAQTDVDNDGEGDACEIDDDADGVGDAEDNCPSVVNPPSDCDANPETPDKQCDTESDGVGDACDTCWSVSNVDQVDLDDDCAASPYSSDPLCGDVCDVQTCGNGKIESPEACDLGASNTEDGLCTLSCLEGTLTEEQFKTKVLDTLQRQLTVVGSGQDVDPIQEERAKKKRITELFLVYLRGLS